MSKEFVHNYVAIGTGAIFMEFLSKLEAQKDSTPVLGSYQYVYSKGSYFGFRIENHKGLKTVRNWIDTILTGFHQKWIIPIAIGAALFINNINNISELLKDLENRTNTPK